MDQIKLITHNDLDGVGCAIVVKALNPHCEVEVVTCGNDNVNEVVQRHLAFGDQYSQFIISDLSVNEETAEQIEDLYQERSNTVILLDHHKTALWLNDKYKWAKVKVTDINHFGIECKTCGTQLVYEYFEGFNDMSHIGIKLNTFVELVRSYDTWDWSVNKYTKPKKINDLFKVLGEKRFIKKVVDFLQSTDSEFLINSTDEYILELEQERIDKYIREKQKSFKTINLSFDNHEYICAVVFADKYISELGNELCKLSNKIDMVAIVMSDNISFRSIKDDVDVSILAKKYGGGGHKHAAGIPFDNTGLLGILSIDLNK